MSSSGASPGVFDPALTLCDASSVGTCWAALPGVFDPGQTFCDASGVELHPPGIFRPRDNDARNPSVPTYNV
jgi:hypothetical protein